MRKVSLTPLRLLVISPIIFASWFSQAADSQSVTFTGKVVGVSDGDTISVMRGGRAVEVRLHGIDCPEEKQAFGTKAKKFTSDLAFGREITVQSASTILDLGPR